MLKNEAKFRQIGYCAPVQQDVTAAAVVAAFAWELGRELAPIGAWLRTNRSRVWGHLLLVDDAGTS